MCKWHRTLDTPLNSRSTVKHMLYKGPGYSRASICRPYVIVDSTQVHMTDDFLKWSSNVHITSGEFNLSSSDISRRLLIYHAITHPDMNIHNLLIDMRGNHCCTTVKKCNNYLTIGGGMVCVTSKETHMTHMCVNELVSMVNDLN